MVYERVGISLAEVYERVENFVILVHEKALKAYLTCILWKGQEKRSGLRFMHILKRVQLQQLKGCEGLNKVFERGAICQ